MLRPSDLENVYVTTEHVCWPVPEEYAQFVSSVNKSLWEIGFLNYRCIERTRCQINTLESQNNVVHKEY